ncbi:MAG TPA: MarP family serine protease [Jatrophihabitans sp.]|nr:MarP family serine protease [Jatrophihabitans sp.]
MNLLDLIILLAVIGYGVGGYRSGAVVGLCSLIGFFGGAVIGAQLAQPLGSAVADGRAQVPVAIFCVLVFATLGQLAGVYLAGHIKRRFVVHERSRVFDSGIGAVLGVVSVLLVAWMVAVPLARSPYPSLASEASHSKIVRWVNGQVPSDFRELYSSLRGFLDQSGFPPVFGDLPSTSIVAVAPPPKNLPADVQHRVAAAQTSIVKVYSRAPECSRGIEGSGFVFAPHRVLTNAHVVAGARQVELQQPDGDSLAATVVLYDPDRDVAVLAVPGLSARPLRFAAKDAPTGQPALVVGYPENGPYTVRSARVRAKQTVGGTDIYGKDSVRRSIYSVRAVVRAGNSGGPLLAYDGTVLGMVFATASDSPDTGFALTDDEVSADAAQGRRSTLPVATGACTPD